MPCSATSLIRTGTLALTALTCAMPAPISPPPKTAVLLIAGASSLRHSFFISVVAKKIPRSALDSSLITSVAKLSASVLYAFSSSSSTLARTALIIASGAG